MKLYFKISDIGTTWRLWGTLLLWLVWGCAPQHLASVATPPAPPTWPDVEKVAIADLFSHRPAGFRLVQPLELPRVLFLQYPDLTVQGQGMNRVAALIEKRGSSDHSVLNDKELAALVATSGRSPATFFLGHDYRGRDLARFFTLAPQGHVALNPTEKELFTLLLRLGFFTISKNGELLPGAEEFVLVTLPPSGNAPGQLSPAEWRDTLRHELSHGEFFTNPRYREYCQQQWASLDLTIRQIFQEEFHYLGYNQDNKELMVNEWQAFLWEPLVGGFIDVRLHRIGLGLTALRLQFLAGIDGTSEPITKLFDVREFREVPPLPEK